MNRLEIWSPKYSTDSVLIAEHKLVSKGDVEIIFTKAKHLEGGVYTIDCDKVRTHPKQPNGKGYVYVVPMGELEVITEPVK